MRDASSDIDDYLVLETAFRKFFVETAAGGHGTVQPKYFPMFSIPYFL